MADRKRRPWTLHRRLWIGVVIALVFLAALASGHNATLDIILLCAAFAFALFAFTLPCPECGKWFSWKPGKVKNVPPGNCKTCGEPLAPGTK